MDPVNSRLTCDATDASSGLTSSVMMGEPDLASRATRPWPISPPAPVMRTTGFRIYAAPVASLPFMSPLSLSELVRVRLREIDRPVADLLHRSRQ